MVFSIVGLDPSLAATGIAGKDGDLWTLKQKPKDGDVRLVNIYAGVAAAVAGSDLVVMEDLPRNAMGAGVTGMVQGVCRLAMRDLGVPYITITPATLKKFATGKGNAKKPDMRAAWFNLTGMDNKDDNQVDAAWLRVIGLYLTGQIREHGGNAECVESSRELVKAIENGFVLN